ncbi:MAG: hypothetical protein IJ756_00575 [Paludibacteraceae bacterium]|jgi:hypothetical protein|nr:hypothetical protein [Paludibacteraceae bacterium]
MKKYLLLVIGIISATVAIGQLVSPETLAKRAKRKNLILKEWNTDQRSKTRWLDRVTKYDQEGRKIEEIEYASYGQKWRITIEYNDSTGLINKEVEYDDRDKPVRIRKYDYNENGTKKRQYNYAPNGKLQTVKVFEYIFED